MAEPQIVPPPPAVTQPSSPVDNSPGMDVVQRAFDKAYPDIKPKAATAPPPEAPPEKPPAPPPPQPEPEPPKPAAEEKLPSFLEQALKLDKPVTPPPGEEKKEVEVEWSEELPPEQKQSRIKGLRDAYKTLKTEVETLRRRPVNDPQQQQRVAMLENHNKQMAEALSRIGVEHSIEFQQGIMQPLYVAWNEAARIVRDSGGDPNELAKAMSLNGRSQFEALDLLFADMPESARSEAHDALRVYRRYEEARRNAVANAPQTLEGIRHRETERQYQEISKQKEDMKGMFDRALSALRDDAKVEVFQKTGDTDGKWWNDQSDRLVEAARGLFLENTDLDKMAFACLLAPAADAYRNLFIKSQQRIAELQKIINDKIGSEPNLSESSGNAGSPTPSAQFQDDLKRPFQEVFLREFHRSQARNR